MCDLLCLKYTDKEFDQISPLLLGASSASIS